ncbi:MAG: 5'-methylthioadenosine/S-adenosylhomocysteine nucleosidase [Kofleriaceae bacterium]
MLALLGACVGTSPRVVVLVSANAEWQAVTSHTTLKLQSSPYGEWARDEIGGVQAIIMHGGYGKTSAAGSAQYAIDRWHPELVINIGTAGGFSSDVKVGDIVLVTKTTIYDIYEAMGDAAETVADYASVLDPKWPASLESKVKRGPIVSGDRDLIPTEVDKLHAQYNASVGDWESGSIAFVARKNHVRVIILRAITDVLDAQHPSPTTGNIAEWQQKTKLLMVQMLDLLDQAMPQLLSNT